jgi:hypothetical protein
MPFSFHHRMKWVMFELAAQPHFLAPATAVFIGGLAALGVAIGGWYIFPKLRHLDRLTDLCSPDESKLKGDKNDR